MVISHMVYQLFQFVKVSMFWYTIAVKYAAFDELFVFLGTAAVSLVVARLSCCVGVLLCCQLCFKVSNFCLKCSLMGLNAFSCLCWG